MYTYVYTLCCYSYTSIISIHHHLHIACFVSSFVCVYYSIYWYHDNHHNDTSVYIIIHTSTSSFISLLSYKHNNCLLIIQLTSLYSTRWRMGCIVVSTHRNMVCYYHHHISDTFYYTTQIHQHQLNRIVIMIILTTRLITTMIAYTLIIHTHTSHTHLHN